MSIKLGNVFGNVSDKTRNAARHVAQTAVFFTGIITGPELGFAISAASDFKFAAALAMATAGAAVLGTATKKLSNLIPARGQCSAAMAAVGATVAAAASFGLIAGTEAVVEHQFPDSAFFARAIKAERNHTMHVTAPSAR